MNAKSHVDTSDASRMDGHITQVWRDLELQFLLHCFPSEYRGQIMDLHGAQYNLKGFTSAGVKYDTGSSRASGSPETADLNTLLTAAISYYALRRMGYQPGPAFRALGIYGGDDALNADIDPEKLISSGKAFGQVIESNVIKRGEHRVNFLARYFSPEVWNGASDSCCDIRRQLQKFHLTVKLTGLTPVDKLKAKALSFYLTDGNTPVIGLFCHKVLELMDNKEEEFEPDKRIMPYFGRFKKEVQFPNADTGGWMMEELMLAYPDANLGRFVDWLQEVDTLEKMLHPPIIAEADFAVQPTVPAPAVVNNVAVYPKAPTPPPTSKPAAAIKPKRVAKAAKPAKPKGKRGSPGKH